MADIIINCGRLKLEKFLYCYPLENFMLKYLPNWVYIQIPYIFVLRGEMVKWCKSGIKVADCVRSKIVYRCENCYPTHCVAIMARQKFHKKGIYRKKKYALKLNDCFLFVCPELIEELDGATDLKFGMHVELGF